MQSKDVTLPVRKQRGFQNTGGVTQLNNVVLVAEGLIEFSGILSGVLLAGRARVESEPPQDQTAVVGSSEPRAGEASLESAILQRFAGDGGEGSAEGVIPCTRGFGAKLTTHPKRGSV